MTKCALTLAIGLALAAGTLSNATAAPPDSQRYLAAPFPANALIYRPDCSIIEDSSLCDGGGR
jgi:hypothetical protein